MEGVFRNACIICKAVLFLLLLLLLFGVVLVILLGEERERERGDRKTFEIQTRLRFALALFSLLLLFTFHRRKKFFVVALRVFLLKYFSVLCLCARVTSLRPQASVCDATLKREIDFKQKKTNDMERVEVHLRRKKSKKRRVF